MTKDPHQADLPPQNVVTESASAALRRLQSGAKWRKQPPIHVSNAGWAALLFLAEARLGSRAAGGRFYARPDDIGVIPTLPEEESGRYLSHVNSACGMGD